MSTPKVTIGIPHLNRTELLQRAIDSCLKQTKPVHVIIADQGKTDETAKLLARYEGHPNIERVDSTATCLWENWDFAARHCDTPYFAWLQDDDVLARGFAAHVEACFELFPNSLHMQARIYCGVSETQVAPWGGCFPWVVMDVLNNKPTQWPGQVLVPAAYLTSWALSPGVAFRCGEAFTRALNFIPGDADLWAERTILAIMGMQGPFVVDPFVAGIWIQHTQHERFNQWKDQERQKKVTVEHLDELMDATDWQDYFASWCLTMNAQQVLGWHDTFECGDSRHAEELKRIMRESLKGRVNIGYSKAENGVTLAPGVRSTRAPGQPVTDRELVWN